MFCTNNIDHKSFQYIATTIISTGFSFQQKCHKFQVLIMPLLPHDHKHSRRRGIMNTVYKLLKLQCLNNGFHFLEFKSNWLNNDDSLNLELFYDDDLYLIRNGTELLAKEIINSDYHLKYTVAYSRSSYKDVTSFLFNYADLKASLLILLTLYNPQSFLVTLIFQLLLKGLLPSLLWNPVVFSFY